MVVSFYCFRILRCNCRCTVGFEPEMNTANKINIVGKEDLESRIMLWEGDVGRIGKSEMHSDP